MLVYVVHSIFETAIAPVLAAEHPVISSVATLLLTRCNSVVNDASVQSVDSEAVSPGLTYIAPIDTPQCA